MATSKVQTGLRLYRDFYAEVKAIADMDRRSVNNFIELVLHEYVDRFKQEHGPLNIDDRQD